jgi:hypothetical protein
MKNVTRRIQLLEHRMLPPRVTEHQRYLVKRLEAAKRRIQQARERGESGPPSPPHLVEIWRRRLVEARRGFGFNPQLSR